MNVSESTTAGLLPGGDENWRLFHPQGGLVDGIGFSSGP